MSYTLTDYSATEVELNDGIRSYYYKKCYCSVELQGEYIVFTSHKVEHNAFRQQWSIAYTDFTSPTGTASAVYNAIKTIIENYAGGATSGFVPYTGATGDVDLGTHGLTTDFVEFSLSPTASPGTGQIAYNGATGSLAYLMNSSTVQSEIGQTLHAYVHNAEAVTITKGQAVYLYQASGNKASVKLAYNTSDATSAKTFGLAAENISANQKGFVMCQGSLDGLNTGAYTAGDTLYLGATAGSITNVKPYAPNHLVYVGIVERANAGNGQIYVRTQNGYELDELHNVQAQSPSNNDVLYYDSASSQWKTASLATILGYTPANAATAVTSVTGTSPVVSSGGLTPAISMPVATSSANGYLSSTDWSSFNNNMLGFGQYRKAGRWYTNALFGPSNGTVSITANQISYLPFWVDASFTLTGLGVNVTTAGAAASTARLGIYTNAGATTAPSTRLVDSGTFLIDTTGPKTVTGLSVALTKGLYWLAFFTNSASGAITGFGNDRIIDVRGLAAIGGIGFARNTQALAYAALPATAGSLADVNATTTHCIYYTL